MQIEIDVEGLISRSIADGILDSNNIRKEVDKILRSDEYQKILTRNIKTRLDEILSSEDGKKQVDKSIVEGIVDSDDIQDEVEKILDSCEYQEILSQHAKNCLSEILLSEEGKKQISSKIGDYLENYEVEYDDDVNDELKKCLSEIFMMTMRDTLEKFKTFYKQ